VRVIGSLGWLRARAAMSILVTGGGGAFIAPVAREASGPGRSGDRPRHLNSYYCAPRPEAATACSDSERHSNFTSQRLALEDTRRQSPIRFARRD